MSDNFCLAVACGFAVFLGLASCSSSILALDADNITGNSVHAPIRTEQAPPPTPRVPERWQMYGPAGMYAE